MFNVIFYTFAKRENSTAIPSAAGTTFSCIAKMPLNIINPTIQLQLTGGATANPVSYNYCYIASFNRYYRVGSWRNVGPLWEADLVVDALASWKTAIGNQSIYVFRSAYSYDLKVPDNLYPTKAQTRVLNISLPKIWTIGGTSASGAATNTGYYIAAIISTSGTRYYIFTETGWIYFLNQLFDDDYYESILTTFGAVEYPEAKVAINPMQYISWVKWVPVGLAASGNWCLHSGSAISGLAVGVSSVSLSALGAYHCWSLEGHELITSIEDIDTEAADFAHPQADSRGDWLNYAPYTSFELFYPPYGLISLDPVMISKYRYLRVSLTTDIRGCTCKLDIYCHDNNTHRVIYRGMANFGVDVPVSGIVQPGTSPMSLVSSALNVVGGALAIGTGNIVGGVSQILGGVDAAIGSAVNGQIPHLSTMGGPGSPAAMDGAPRLYVTQWYLANDDLADRGRPLMDTRTISAIPGYIMGDSDNISIACTEQELATIKQAIATGFFYE